METRKFDETGHGGRFLSVLESARRPRRPRRRCLANACERAVKGSVYMSVALRCSRP